MKTESFITITLKQTDKFEDSLTQGMVEPTTPEYEAEASAAEEGGDIDAGMGGELEGGEEEEEFDLGGLQVINVLEENQRKKR